MRNVRRWGPGLLLVTLPASGDGALFVIALEPRTNTVVVGANEELFAPGLIASDINSAAHPDLPNLVDWLAVSARIRYNGAASPARICEGSEPGTVQCVFQTPQRAITPGQAAVFYEGDRVLGGGTIRCALKPDENLRRDSDG